MGKHWLTEFQRKDLPILCERFTTSKLKTFEDLSSIGTYGFRGEALASISHIAHLTITTKTGDSSCAWRAHFADGQLVSAKPGQNAEPKPTAGRNGTQIKVEDLFYNVISRQKAFRSPSEEYAKILDVVGRYAVHCTGVAFSCKKQGESAMGISTPSTANTVDSIRQIHGSAVANELVGFEIKSNKWGFKASGWTSNANYHMKRTTMLLFINHRSVESTTIKRAVEQTYTAFLPKGGRPFIYLSLDIEPQRVDVNVHPTKREVNFLNEDEIIEEVCTEIRTKLSQVDTSRTFSTQSLLPSANISSSNLYKTPGDRFQPTQKSTSSVTTRPYENSLVRTDPNLRKITSMLVPSASTDGNENSVVLPGQPVYISSPRPRTVCAFKSIKQLRASVRDAMHDGLSQVLSSLTYVGLVDPTRRISAIQSGVKLFLVDYGLLSNEFFYQVGLADFENFGALRFDPPFDVRTLIHLGVEHEKAQEKADDAETVPWDKVPDMVTSQLVGKSAMLLEYFNFDISPDGQLISLPLLLKGYTPSLAKLPKFLMRLGPCVDWEDEYECFHTFLRELASFYTPEQLPSKPVTEPAKDPVADRSMDEDDHGDLGPESAEIAGRRLEMERMLEHVLFPAFRSRLVATKGLLKGVVEVANLKGLYRVFERC